MVLKEIVFDTNIGFVINQVRCYLLTSKKMINLLGQLAYFYLQIMLVLIYNCLLEKV